jgi:hypothetical protein
MGTVNRQHSAESARRHAVNRSHSSTMNGKTGTVLLFMSLLIGCASTGVVPTDRGAYMLSKQSAAGVFGSPEGVKADIYREANEFCARTGQAVETISADTKGAVPFVRTGSASLHFRCVAAK